MASVSAVSGNVYEELRDILKCLTEVGQSDLATHPIEEVLRVAKALNSAAHDLDAGRADLIAFVARGGAVLGQEHPWSGLPQRLHDLLQALRGQAAESLTLARVLAQATQFSTDCSDYAAALSVAERQHAARRRLADAMDRAAQILAHPCFALVCPPASALLAEARQILERSGDTEDSQRRLQPLFDQWRSRPEEAGFAEHYGGADVAWPTEEWEDEVLAAERLTSRLGRISDWVTTTAHRLIRLELKSLPPAPRGEEPWFVGALVPLTLFLELHLAPQRATVDGAAATLAHLARLAHQSGLLTDSSLPSADVDAIHRLLELSLLEKRFLDGLGSVGRILGDEAAARQAASLLVSTHRRDPLWRIQRQEFDRPGASSGRAILRRALSQASGLPPDVWLHLLVAGTPDRAGFLELLEKDPQAIPYLLRLGVLGAWGLAGILDERGVFPRSDEIERTLASHSPVRHGYLLPLVSLRSASPSEPGLSALLAALELTANRSSPELLGKGRVWSFMGPFAHDFPALCQRLQHLQLNESLSSSYQSAQTSNRSLQQREIEAVRTVRPRNFRGVASLESICRSFVNEVASPLLVRAREAETRLEVQQLLSDVAARRAELSSYVAHQSRSFLNAPQGKLAQVLRHECETMLEAIERYLLELQNVNELPRKDSREELQGELERLARTGWAGQEAANLFRSVLARSPSIVLECPGNSAAIPAAFRWSLPATFRAWCRCETQPHEYLSCLCTDLLGNGPLDFVLSASADGQLNYASQVLQLMPTRDPLEVQRQLDEDRQAWRDLISAERDQLRRQRQALPADTLLDDMFESLDQNVAEEAFDVAALRLAELRADIQLRLEEVDQPLSRDALLQQVDDTHLRLNTLNVDLSRSAKREIREQLIVLEQLLEPAEVGEDDRRKATKGLRALTARLESVATTTSLAAPPTTTTQPLANQPSAPAAAVSAPEYFGVVKFMLGQNFGFLVPLLAYHPATADPPDHDVFFHSNILTRSDNFGQELEDTLGRFVVFQLGELAPSHRAPPAAACRVCTPEEEAELDHRLASKFGRCPLDIGVLWEIKGRRTVLTLGRGAFVARFDGGALPRGSLVQFEVYDPEQRQARVLGLPEPGTVDASRRELLEKLVNRPIAEPLPLLDSRNWSTSISAIRPGTPQALALAREIHRSIRETQQFADVLHSVDQLLERGVPGAYWWRAVFVYPCLRHAPSTTDLLDELVLRQEEWTDLNFDTTAAWVYKCVADFIADFRDRLSPEDVLQFLHHLQQARGANPHFRLEILQVRQHLQCYEDQGDASHLQEALQHVSRALILNPRISEAHDLRTKVEAEIRSAGTVPLRLRAPSPLAMVDTLPADPIEAVEQITLFYQQLASGTGGPHDSDAFFSRIRPQAQGLVLVQLVQEHARFLLQRERAADAVQTLTGHILEQEPAPGLRPLLRLLYDAWTAQQLTLDQVAQQIDTLRPRVAPEELYYLSLILARFAFEERHYDLALSYAQESDQAAPNADAQRLMDRARKLIDGRNRADGSAPLVLVADVPQGSTETRRRLALERIQRVVASQEDQGPIELILDFMDDATLGPWLVLQVVAGDFDLGLSPGTKSDLVNRALAVASEPSSELLRADFAVRWSEHREVRQEGGFPEDHASLLQVILQHAEAERSRFLSRLQDELNGSKWRLFAILDALGRQLHQDAAIRWARGLAARRVKRAEDYVDSALGCLGDPRVPAATYAQLASDLLRLELPGLALGMSLMSNEPTTQTLQEMAEKKCLLQRWQWPACLHESRDLLAAESWVEAADRIIRVLLAAPEHWPNCRTFGDVFSHPFEDDPIRGRRALEMSEAVVSYLQKRHSGELPELLVLQAELRQHREGLGGRRLIRTETTSQLQELCVAATKLRRDFQPALAMLKHLRAAESTPITEGASFFNYRVERHLGGGSFGQVYKASVLDPMHDRPSIVALKFVRPDAPTDEKREQRLKSLRREATIARRLDHPSIVRTYEFIDDRCLVMQYIDGQTLEDPIDGRIRYPWPKVASIGLQIAQALRHAGEVALEVVQGEGSTERHAADFAHRDIHPKNIMVVEEKTGLPRAYLLDFGLARLPGGTMTSLVKDVNKRMHYRDPNYPRGDFRGDMFSLGVILYELLSGNGPYPIDRYCEYLGGQQVDFDTEPKLVGDLLPPGVTPPPQILQIALRKMVAFNASARYGKWDALIDDLTRALDIAASQTDNERGRI